MIEKVMVEEPVLKWLRNLLEVESLPLNITIEKKQVESQFDLANLIDWSLAPDDATCAGVEIRWYSKKTCLADYAVKLVELDRPPETYPSQQVKIRINGLTVTTGDKDLKYGEDCYAPYPVNESLVEHYRFSDGLISTMEKGLLYRNEMLARDRARAMAGAK